MFSWNEEVKPYEELLLRIRAKLERANKVFYKQLGYSPIDDIHMRIKSEISARTKLEEKNLSFSFENLSFVRDLAGIRIVCKFIDDIPEIVSLIKSWQNFKVINQKNSFSYEQIKVVEEKDYVSIPKESGYRSYHLICEDKGLLFEIQIRTLAMNFWATSEHMLKYKYGGEIPLDVKNKLKSIADISASLDSGMNEIRHDVSIGTAKSRIMEQLYKAIHLLEENKMGYKAEHYRDQIEKNKDDLEALRSLAVRAKEEVPKQFWVE
jgi:putative GTP pyrophosphokinase